MSHTAAELKSLRQSSVKSTDDRTSALGAQVIFERLYDDPELRRSVMRILAEAVQTAHSNDQRVWTISLFAGAVRLNVGKALVLELLPNALWIVADPRAMEPDDRDAVEPFIQERGLYKVLDAATTAYFATGDDIRHLAQKVAPGHVATLRQASSTQSGNTPYRQAWSPGVVKLLENELGVRLPRPAWEREPKAPTLSTKEAWWKIAPGRKASEWPQCLAEGEILIGWANLGDLRGVDEAEFLRRRDALVAQQLPGYTAGGMDQVWRFRTIAKGDWIVANEGTSRVVGVGRVTGPYYFKAGGHHPHRLPVDWLDVEPFAVQQGGWVKTLRKLNAKTVAKIREHLESSVKDDPQPPPSREAAFSRRAFELLALLGESPRRDTYNANKDEFAHHLLNPFQTLFREVVASLPPLMTRGLETRRRLFGQIPKNDYGQGGAWTFYWGALYPQEEKRTTGAQLFVWMDANVLRFGMSIGELSSAARDRFNRNLEVHRSAILKHGAELFVDEGLIFGAPDGDGVLASTGSEWLERPAHFGVAVARELAAGEVLAPPRSRLLERVASTFQTVFPLFVLAAEDDPAPVLTAWWDDSGDEEDTPEELQPVYPFEQLAAESMIPPARLRQWLAALSRKGQAVLYGPPGTGKTWVAQRMANHLVGGTAGFIEVLQLHPAYAYEDFMQGIRPVVVGDKMSYSVVPGRFLEFCKRARDVGGAPCVLILDELNRANLSRVFGELMYLLEYRDADIPLSGGGRFSIPPNVRILGTMNTADRSIALVDHALRRRFAFLQLEPLYEVLERFHQEQGVFDPSGLVAALKQVNASIDDANYSVGISFFLRSGIDEELEGIWRLEIEPYLAEYFFDRPAALAELRWDKLGPKMLL